MIPAEKSTKRISNAAVYGHIPTAKIVELYDSGLSYRKIGKMLRMGPCSVGNRLRQAGKRRECSRVSPEQLEECRLDPAWEARNGVADKVVCRECGEFKASINAHGEHSHLLRHNNMTADDYANKYPGARLFSFKTAWLQSVRQGRKKTLKQHMEQFAADYLTAAELLECRKDHEWEERRGFDFVVCRRCGLKSRTDLWAHSRRHGYERIDDYRAEYPMAPQVPRCLDGYRREIAKERYAREKAERQEQEALVQQLRAKQGGRPRTREEDATKYGPRVKELRAQGKSWPMIARIMKVETGQEGTATRWRLLVRSLPTLSPRSRP